jgi:aryl-alcohol dehydrogenase-like predicted oxidoreductase
MTVERFALAPGYEISRLLRGGWQLAGGHGPVDAARAVDDMFAFVDAGVTVFDCADIYTGVEELIGEFRRRLLASRGSAALAGFKVHTKFVPDWDDLATCDAAYMRAIVERSLKRLSAERLDLVQFHWWNYAVQRHAEIACVLADLAREGKIDQVGATNFDTPHTQAMFDAGVKLASMQVQYSLLDARPETALAGLCARTGMKLLCYGTLAGGFLSKAWLGKPEPSDLSHNRSLVKYKLVIDDFGGWELFQELLAVCQAIGDKHGVSLSCVAGRWTLDRPHVAGIIVGARYAAHLADNLGMFAFALDAHDRARIDAVLARRQGPLGDTYTLERDKEGRHGRIMKYNLNKP